MNNIIASEIRIHDAIGNATSIGGHAIRLRFNPQFHAPMTAGYHLYDTNAKLITTLHDYQIALNTSREQHSILAWREDLNSPLPITH